MSTYLHTLPLSPRSLSLPCSSSPLVPFQFSFGLRSLSPGLSIDYVFDGTSPPYVPSAQPNPLNQYAISKRDAELAVLGVEGAHVAVLRIPVLCVPLVIHYTRMIIKLMPKFIVDMALLRQMQNRRSTSYLMSCRTSRARSTTWIITRLASLPTCSILPVSSFVLGV
jgi:hypothetical protein